MFIRCLVLVPVLAIHTGAGCKHATGVGAAPPAAAAPPAEKPIATAPEARPFRLADGATGQAMDESALGERLRGARAIFVGEQHDNPHHHFVQVEVLRRVIVEAGTSASVGVAFEMLPYTLQEPLADFAAGKTDEPTFLRAVDWQKTWGFPFGLYQPLLALCREHHLPAFALNTPRALTRAVSKKGIDGLTPEERAALPESVPGPAAHREYARQAFGAHAVSRFTDQRFERFYRAQLTWDETMAQQLAAAFAAPGAPQRIVVVAGEGHTRRAAIPERAARRGVSPYLLVLAVEEKELPDALADHAADVLFVFTGPAKPPRAKVARFHPAPRTPPPPNRQSR